MLPVSRRNASKIRSGRDDILDLLNKVDSRCNVLFNKRLSGAPVDYMSCSSTVFEDSEGEAVVQGRYDFRNCIHAEMDALAQYISRESDFRTIEKIEITAPPCKSCAFVLELLGVISKVKSTGGIKKHFTGSWRWPEALKDTNTFDFAKWSFFKSKFINSGLSDSQILDEIVKVVQYKSAY